MLEKSILEKINTTYNSDNSKQIKDYRIKQLCDYWIEDQQIVDEINYKWEELNNKSQTWQNNKLQYDNRGVIMTNRPTNLKIILTDHDKFKNLLSFNELTRCVCYNGKEIYDLDFTQLRVDICDELQLSFKKADVVDIAELVARCNSFHPIKKYLTSLKWDGKKRVKDFTSIMGVETTELNVEVMTKFLISAVKRIMEPGCKVDSIPVFQGLTGNRKSSALKALMHDESWFSDEPVDFGTKDSKQILLGKWFVELAELSTLNKKENNLIKSDITQQVDEFRSPYDRKPQKYPRQFVYIGTTNDLEFLTDPTSNRRFWILPNNGLIDTNQIVEMRDQLWAEAVDLYNNKVNSWLSKDQEKEMAKIASNYEVQDAWKEYIITFLNGKTFATTQEILSSIKCSIANVENKDKARVVKIMQFLKWENTTVRINGIPTNGWKKPNTENVIGKEIVQVELNDWN